MSVFSQVKKHFSRHKEHAAHAGPASTDVGSTAVIGRYAVHITSKLAEGGFGSVFVAEDDQHQRYALKKMLVLDQESLEATTREVELMKRLPGHSNIVQLLASEVKPNGRHAEVLLLMEYCPGGHVVDIMNRRLKKPFTESEVLKLENVLLGANKGSFKLCDFGSATTKVIVPGETMAISLAEEEIGRYTTPQYRAPEMIDLYQKRTIDTRADVWALGCLLYKLMFFADAFEDSTLSVLNGRYKIPDDHSFSQELMDLLGHSNIVQLLASEVKPNGRHAEVLLLMEYCPGGHVVDIMNRRLKKPFTESEVLKVIVPGETMAISLAEEEIGRYTTPQYRAPEMIDLYQKRTIDTRADVWALGCLLYKLMFFADAFEDSTLSVLNGRYKIPDDHSFSQELMDLLASLLELDPDKRITAPEACRHQHQQHQHRHADKGARRTTPSPHACISSPQTPPQQQQHQQHDAIQRPSRKGHARSASNPFANPMHDEPEWPTTPEGQVIRANAHAHAHAPQTAPPAAHARKARTLAKAASVDAASAHAVDGEAALGFATPPFAADHTHTPATAIANGEKRRAPNTAIGIRHKRQPSNPFEAAARMGSGTGDDGDNDGDDHDGDNDGDDHDGDDDIKAVGSSTKGVLLSSSNGSGPWPWGRYRSIESPTQRAAINETQDSSQEGSHQPHSRRNNNSNSSGNKGTSVSPTATAACAAITKQQAQCNQHTGQQRPQQPRWQWGNIPSTTPSRPQKWHRNEKWRWWWWGGGGVGHSGGGRKQSGAVTPTFAADNTNPFSSLVSASSTPVTAHTGSRRGGDDGNDDDNTGVRAASELFASKPTSTRTTPARKRAVAPPRRPKPPAVTPRGARPASTAAQSQAGTAPETPHKQRDDIDPFVFFPALAKWDDVVDGDVTTVVMMAE
ncbi:NAK protein kinase [Salpingoeca rosetta]|uniref:non-specific serine/threonine protein kinase n=1 Tax=Salpingoeca rosetta (strain ATCC 50818 / BSB-021) TaxID=946362 RepID=F2UBQ7_SALR5|nr:NAK protein kinase [Salpingoeca rosetta]EGD73923.1 NAK protein kinase [Salpingoeca rosetta]|eukprot:XP_004993486.1 NAK protein kinase [Salpingoeca rosetta]